MIERDNVSGIPVKNHSKKNMSVYINKDTLLITNLIYAIKDKENFAIRIVTYQ